MIYSLLLSDQSIFNHPVHFIRSDLKKSDAKSAFIPFCQFGGNMSLMGVRIEDFEMPVCNCFEATIVNDQICYEVDLNKFSQKKNIQKELKSGFAFIMDYNEDPSAKAKTAVWSTRRGLYRYWYCCWNWHWGCSTTGFHLSEYNW